MPAEPWRAMTAADLPEVSRIASLVHPDFPEDDAVFAERLALFPAGCLFAAGAGYVLAHPWMRGRPPALNSQLGALPARAETLYLHDIALLPEARGQGAGEAALRYLERVARGLGLEEIALVAVSGSARFWGRMGFVADGAEIGSYGDATYMRKQGKDFFF